MEKKKTIAQGMGQMSKSLGKWDDEARRDRQVVVARGTRRTTFKDAEEGSASPPSAADRRGRLRADEDEDSLVNTVKAFAGKTSETVDKYEEARKKSKINRFFKGVRNIFPKKKKKSKGSGADSSDSEGDKASSSSSSSKKRYAKTQEEKRKEREIGGGKFQQKERKKREEEERKRQSELEARRKQRRASSAAADEDNEDESRNQSSEDEEDERRQMKKQEHLLKRAKSAPSQAQLEKEESSDRPHGIREKYRAKLEAKKAAALAELHKEEAEKEQARQRQAAKAEEAAIDSFLERAAQRRRGTEERVGFRSKRASLDQGLTAPLQPSDQEEDEEEDDESAARRRRLGLATKKKENGTSSTSAKNKKEEKGKEVVRTASARTHKKVVPTRGKSEPQTMSGSMGSLATSAAVGGAKLVGRYVQQRLVDENADVDRGEDDEVEEDEEEEEVERAHRWKDRERARKVNERIEETRRQRQAQAQGRRPSLGKSYSWASPRSGDIPVPLSSRDRMMAAIEGATARNSSSSSSSSSKNNGPAGSTSSPRASPSRAHANGSGDRTLWHKKARVIRERSQRNLGGSGGGSSSRGGEMRTTSDRRLN